MNVARIRKATEFAMVMADAAEESGDAKAAILGAVEALIARGVIPPTGLVFVDRPSDEELGRRFVRDARMWFRHRNERPAGRARAGKPTPWFRASRPASWRKVEEDGVQIARFLRLAGVSPQNTTRILSHLARFGVFSVRQFVALVPSRLPTYSGFGPALARDVAEARRAMTHCLATRSAS